jgi:hypothetical protein
MAYQRENMMGEARDMCELTADERHLIALLRQGPQSAQGVAKALGIGLEQTQDILDNVHRKVGLVTLFRCDTLRYGLAE